MLENMRVGGEGRFADSQAAVGREQALAARHYTHDFLAALRCESGTEINDLGVGQVLAELTIDETEMLRVAMCHTRKGRTTEAVYALDLFADAVALRYGSERVAS